MNERAVAAKLIAQLSDQQGSLSTLLAHGLKKVDQRNRALLQAMCFGVCRWQPRLEAYLTVLMDKPLREKEREIRALLWIGLYQLEFMRTPDHAAINSTVEAAKVLKKNWACKLINAVLRNFLRRKNQLAEQLNHNLEFISAHPQWLIEAFSHYWPEQFEAIIAANNSHPPLTLRINRQKISTAGYLQQLHEHNLAAKLTVDSTAGITLEEACDVTQLPGFDDGWFSVQDESAQLSAELLDLKPGLAVLDACCAPGGKTAHLLEREPEIVLTAVDISAERLERTRDNLRRLDLAGAKLIPGDSTQPEQWWDRQLFDRILLDAPCSAVGIIRRQPDIKMLRHQQTVAQLEALQLKLLEQLWPLLKPGGYLLYATCSILPRENAELVRQFLTRTPSAEEIPINANWGVAQAVGRQLLPQAQAGDGFYYARLRKRQNNG